MRLISSGEGFSSRNLYSILMARLKFPPAFFALIICGAGLALAFFGWTRYAQPESSVNRVVEDGAVKLEKPDLGKRHFDAAMSFLREGELVSARDRLLYLMRYFPESETIIHAKRVIGEVNLDLLISPIPQPEKSRYVVSQGEALVTIARRSDSTVDYIMRANGKTTALIYPDEELVVCPLNYRVEICLEGRTLTVFSNDVFFKEYRIVEINLPPEVAGPVTATITEKVARDGDRPVNFTDATYLGCSKWIRTGVIGLYIREEAAARPDSEIAPFGVMVEKSDMQDLFTILRVGTEVKLVH